MGPTKHFRLSPSGMKRILQCPWSAQENLPQLVSKEDKTGGKATTAGSEVHHLAGEVLAGNLSITAVPYDWIDGVAMYVDFVNQNEGDRVVERQWESIAINDYGGTTDCVVIADNKCLIPDFKTGKWDVPAEDNKQLLSYASIVAEHFEVTEFFGAIIQPKVIRGQKIKVAEYSLDQVNDHRAAVAAAAVSTEKGTGDHCRFCPFRLNRSCAEGNAYCESRGWN